MTDFPTLPGFDPLSDEFLRDPVPMITRAQKERPVFYHPPLDMWVITRYADICTAARDFKTFSSQALGMVPPPADLAHKVPDNFVSQHFVAIDPPQHTASRAAVARFFTPKEIEKQAPAIVEIANRLIDGFIERGACDLMRDYCYPLSIEVIVRLLGVPDDRFEDYRTWTEDLFSVFSPKSKAVKPMSEEEKRARWTRLIEGADFFGALVKDREQNPTDDLVSALIAARKADGSQSIPTSQIIRHINELVAAGNDTTANLMGSMLQFLQQNQDQFDEVKKDPALWSKAVEETLRRRGSSPGLFRITTREVEIGGAAIPEGALVWLLFIGGGLDEAKFENPEKFDIHRPNADQHLAFGHGRHMCLGNPLARLEARLGMQTLLERIPDIRISDGQTREYLPVMTVLALEHLNVEWTPRQAAAA